MKSTKDLIKQIEYINNWINGIRINKKEVLKRKQDRNIFNIYAIKKYKDVRKNLYLLLEMLFHKKVEIIYFNDLRLLLGIHNKYYISSSLIDLVKENYIKITKIYVDENEMNEIPILEHNYFYKNFDNISISYRMNKLIFKEISEDSFMNKTLSIIKWK